VSTRQFFSVVLYFFLNFINSAIADWTLISDGYLGSVYLDSKTIRQSNNLITAWQLQDFLKPDKNGVKSRRLLVEINCLKETRRIIYLSSYSEQMAKGKVIFVSSYSGKWEQPFPKSLGDRVMSSICSIYSK